MDQSLIARKKDCEQRNLCFISLKPLEGAYVVIVHFDVGEVKVLPEYVRS